MLPNVKVILMYCYDLGRVVLGTLDGLTDLDWFRYAIA
jgi:hypothetical protein